MFCMDIREIRRQNLWQLRQEIGKGAVGIIAEKAGTDPAYLSTIFNGSRDLGDKVARSIEKAFNKKVGWLDIDNSLSSSSVISIQSRADLTVSATPEEIESQAKVCAMSFMDKYEQQEGERFEPAIKIAMFDIMVNRYKRLLEAGYELPNDNQMDAEVIEFAKLQKLAEKK